MQCTHVHRTRSTMKEATIIIPARNAAATIERAIKSALIQGDYPLVLVDDFSDDETVERSKSIAGDRLTLLRPAEHRTLGFVRQTGLEAVQTPFLVWLDADDELLPGRVDRLLQAMMSEHTDIAADGAEIIDGETGALRSISLIPFFLRQAQPPVREFERNYLPGDGVAGFRTECLRSLRYDTELHSDIDVILRAIAAGCRFSLLDAVGYRIYAYPFSLSRRIVEQRQMYRAALLKHRYTSVRELYRAARYNPRITAWGLASMALFRQDYDAALAFIDEASGWIEHPMEILEPDGPMPYPEGWRAAFHRGTTLLLLGRPAEALESLEKAELLRSTPEGNNNLGVALSMQGERCPSREHFEKAVSLYPGYLDAGINLKGEPPLRITPHPLRMLATRDDYRPDSLNPQPPSGSTGMQPAGKKA